ncbi:hypothetical protein [Pantoea coffeiphila]|uniref:hypothetical protein n=1 Tax=Pantoea coffeiphila TaxID=1465635 RepID=UPI00196072F9|nr:hypothetical protein [Pantoea coffeiphila]MBM7343692.1 hypothetical protein [Pantoea coffeiphila]
MLTVYCEKMTQSWLNGPMFGLIGILIGAALGLLTAYCTQRWQHTNALSLEKERMEVKLFTDFALNDLLKYIDVEMDYIQRIYASKNGGSISLTDICGHHRGGLAKYKALLSIFKNNDLIKKFDRLLTYRDKFSEIPMKNKNGEVISNPALLLDEAAELTGEIKLILFSHCSLDKVKG